MTIAMTDEQRRDFDEKGYVLLEDFFTPAELERLLAAIDEMTARVRETKGLGPGDHFQIRNLLAHHDAFLDLIDHPRMLPLVVDAIGWNIQIRTTHLDIRPPYPKEIQAGELGRGKGEDKKAGYRNIEWHPDLAGTPLFEGPSLDGRLPFLEIKVGYYLSDLTEHNSGALAVVPGSHLRRPQELRDSDRVIDPREIVELNVRAGTALLWRTAVWHCVTPNLSERVRKVIYVGYNYRWMRPTDFVQQDPALIARCSPIRQQLLAVPLTDGRITGEDPQLVPGSPYWQTDNVPLRAWAEERGLTRERIKVAL